MPISPLAGFNWFPRVSSEAPVDPEPPDQLFRESLDAKDEQKYVEPADVYIEQNAPHAPYTNTYVLPKTKYGLPLRQEMFENNEFSDSEFSLQDNSDDERWWDKIQKKEAEKQRAARIAFREAVAREFQANPSNLEDPFAPAPNDGILPENRHYAAEYYKIRTKYQQKMVKGIRIEHKRGKSGWSSQSSLLPWDCRLVSTEYEVREEIKKEVEERVSYFAEAIEAAKRCSLEHNDRHVQPGTSPENKRNLSPKRWLNKIFGKEG